MKSNQAPTNSLIPTHRSPHVDDVATLLVIEKVTGKKNVFNCLLNAGKASEEEKAKMIGAGGSHLDEHVNGGSGRRKDSAFALAIEELGLTKNHKAIELAKFINRVDSGAGVDHYDLSKVLQEIHRVNPALNEVGIDWCFEILDSYWEDNNYFSRPASECGVWFEKLGCIWLGSRFGKQSINDLVRRFFTDKIEMSFDQAIAKVDKKDDFAINQMARFFQNGCERMLQPFALPRALSAVNSKKGIRTAVKLAMKALDAKFESEESFQSAKEEIEASGETFKAGRFQVYRTITGNKKTKDAILNSRKDISVIIQKNPYSGSVQIFSRTSSGVRFEKLAAAIRLEELKLAGKTTNEFSPEDLEGAGNTCGVQNWFFIVQRKENGVSKGSYMLLSGSDSYPDIKPNVPWNKIKEIIIDVFEHQK